MKDKELVKFFLSDADEYYGLKEKKEEMLIDWQAMILGMKGQKQ